MFGALRDLILPQVCALCGYGDQPLCDLCLDLWRGPAQKCARISGVAIFATRPYDSLAASVIVGAKDHHRRWLLPLLVAAITTSVKAILAQQHQPLHLTLVPMPSRPSSLRKRGDDVVLELARRTAQQLRREEERMQIQALRLLRHRRSVRDQSELTLRQRHLNLEGAFELLREPPEGPLIVIDDVITTGASMGEAIRALGSERILGGACAAATSLRAAARRGAPA